MENIITVLYVDDEPINIMIFEKIFKRKFNVVSAVSGVLGLEVLRSNNDIKAVISDMKMPNMNGIQFITLAKNEFPNLPFYILTGYSLNDEIEDALNNNLICKLLNKPFNTTEIENELSKWQ